MAADLTFNVSLAKDKKAKGETDAKGRLQVRADGMTFTPSAGALAAPAAAAAKTRTLEIAAADITGIEWQHVSSGLQAKVLAKGAVWRFYGFTADAATTSNFFAAAKAMGKDVKKVETATKGQNWGQMNVKPGRMLSFESEDGKAVFDLPLAQVQQSVVQGKNEVSLEMHEEDDGMGVVLSEMRVYVPPNMDQQEGEPTAVEVFRNQIVDGADLGDGAVEAICKFDELMFATPRGKYTIAIYPDFFKLQGKSFSYKIPYATISKLFLMSLPDKQHEHLVMSLSTAIRQGRTAYPFLIMTISQAQETENFKINLPEADFKGKYNGMLTPVMAKSKTADLVARVFKAIAEKKVLVPSSKFTAASGGRAVRCSLKANSGYLFFFEKSFFFVPKPAAYLPHSKVQSVEFRRLEEGGSNKSFDLVITMKGSEKDGHVFTSIDKSEHQLLFDFMRSHKLNIINQRSVEELLNSSADPTKRPKKNINYNEDDPYMSKINAERGDEKPAAGGGDDDDDDEDDDFVAEASSDSGDDGGGSGSGSDSDSGSGSGSDSDGDAKKKTKTKGKRKRDSDSDDDGGKKSKDKAKDKSPKKKSDKPKEKKPASRGKSSYMFFAEEERARIKADPAHKDKTFGEVGKLMGERWNQLSAAAKAPYEAKANQDKERVKAANAANGGGEAKAKASKPRAGKKADANAPPSRAKSAYQFFAADERARLKKAGDKSDAKELTKKITATWKELPAKDKEKYENLHLEDDDRYHREKKEWDAAHPELAKEMAESKKKKKKKGAADDDDGDDDADKPKPKPVTATIKKPAAAAAAAKPAAAAASKPAAKPAAAAAAAKPAAKPDKPAPMET